MVNIQFYLPFLKGLLLAAKIINIRIRNVVSLTEKAIRSIVDDFLRHIIKRLNGISKHSCIENVVVISAAIEADELISDQLLDILRRRVYHSDNRTVLALKLPIYKKQVWKYLNVKEYELIGCRI